MQTYIGTKIIQAQPMSRLEYNSYRGWIMPHDENGNDQGYLVEYTGTGNPNHTNHADYISWSPANVFEEAYTLNGNFTFGAALELLKRGFKVARTGWNGKGMFIFLVSGSNFKVNRPPLLGTFPEGAEINYHAHIDMKTADDKVVPWTVSQTDALAEDWCIVYG